MQRDNLQKKNAILPLIEYRPFSHKTNDAGALRYKKLMQILMLLFSLDQIYWKQIPSKVSEVARDLIAISCQPSEVFSESIIF